MKTFFKTLFFEKGPTYSWKKVSALLVISCTSLSMATVLSCRFYHCVKNRKTVSETAVIEAVVQTGAGDSFTPLQTTLLAEVLGLSADHPAYLGQFDLNQAKECLWATHIFKKLRLKKMKPGHLFIDYTLRSPIAFLGDYANTCVDSEGYFFPCAPFFSPRTLPSIYFGNEAPASPWGEKISEEKRLLVHELLSLLGEERVERLDLSRLHASSVGKREVIVMLKGGTLLRLTPKNYRQQLADYSILKATYLKKVHSPSIVDLRIPEVAYIKMSETHG